MTILDQIIATKREEVARLTSEERSRFIDEIAALPQPRPFIRSLIDHGPIGLIAEIKKASPSKGVIEPDFRPREMAALYERAGAAAISVLTDQTYFQGSTYVLKSVAAQTSLPILRKDFIIDEIQVYEARAIGADAILLIAAALSDDMLSHLYHTASSLSLDVLIEVHSVEEWRRVEPLRPTLIGVNNRNLHTFAVDLSVTEQVAKAVPQDVVLVSESGIASHTDVLRVKKAGARAILVGETLMRFGLQRVESGIRSLLTGVES